MEKQNKYRVVVSEQAKQMLVFHAAFLAQVSPPAPCGWYPVGNKKYMNMKHLEAALEDASIAG